MNTEYLFALKKLTHGSGIVVDWLYGGSLVTKWCDSHDPMDCSSPDPSVYGIS